MKRRSSSLFAVLCLLATLAAAVMLVTVLAASRPRPQPQPVRHPLADQADEWFRQLERNNREMEEELARGSRAAANQPVIRGEVGPDGKEYNRVIPRKEWNESDEFKDLRPLPPAKRPNVDGALPANQNQ